MGRRQVSEHKVYVESGIAAAIGDAVERIIGRFNRPIEVHHTIERKPPPRPQTCQFIVRDNEGHQWWSSAMNITNRTSIPVYLPLSSVTGDPADSGKQFNIQLELNY